ncbi:hypothetical protein [Sphingomonas changbaiensis]|nr:hypothetical protein [Sphingomonas changbaiensis]
MDDIHMESGKFSLSGENPETGVDQVKEPRGQHRTPQQHGTAARL